MVFVLKKESGSRILSEPTKMTNVVGMRDRPNYLVVDGGWDGERRRGLRKFHEAFFSGKE